MGLTRGVFGELTRSVFGELTRSVFGGLIQTIENIIRWLRNLIYIIWPDDRSDMCITKFKQGVIKWHNNGECYCVENYKDDELDGWYVYNDYNPYISYYHNNEEIIRIELC